MNLQDLPLELLVAIDSYLDYASSMAFKLVDCNLHTRLSTSMTQRPKDELTKKEYTMHDLIQIEKWPVYDGMSQEPSEHPKVPIAGRDYFACIFCLRIRNAVHFADVWMDDDYGCGKGPWSTERTRCGRTCLDCWYYSSTERPLGVAISFGGAWWDSEKQKKYGCGVGFFCPPCGKFRRCWSRPRFGEYLICSQCYCAAGDTIDIDTRVAANKRFTDIRFTEDALYGHY